MTVGVMVWVCLTLILEKCSSQKSEMCASTSTEICVFDILINRSSFVQRVFLLKFLRLLVLYILCSLYIMNIVSWHHKVLRLSWGSPCDPSLEMPIPLPVGHALAPTAPCVPSTVLVLYRLFVLYNKQ
jgi:hypothetical protein